MDWEEESLQPDYVFPSLLKQMGLQTVLSLSDQENLPSELRLKSDSHQKSLPSDFLPEDGSVKDAPGRLSEIDPNQGETGFSGGRKTAEYKKD